MRKTLLKKIGILLLLLSLTAGMFPEFSAVSVSAAAQTAESTTAKNGWKKGKAGWVYYVNGKKLKNTWKTINGKKYYFGSDGVRKQGCWYTIAASGGKYYSYYFNQSGAYSGKYKAIDAKLVKTMDKLIKAKKITASTTANVALKRLFNMISANAYGYMRAPQGFKPEQTKDWEYTYAKEMLQNKAGSCYHFAAAFAFLARRATGLPVRIGCGNARTFSADKWQIHSWVEVQINGNWYVYDTNAQRFSTYNKGKWYKLSAAAAKSYYKDAKYINVNI